MRYGYKNIFGFNIGWTWKTIVLLGFLAVLPNFLGLIHTTVFGVRIHFFQYLIFLAAAIYGPLGGAISGAFGSVYTAAALNNPYIVLGNIILGTFTGLFFRFKMHLVLAAMGAYLIQLPWLWFSDIYLAHMPVNVVRGVVVALFISNAMWATVAWLSYKKIKNAANIKAN